MGRTTRGVDLGPPATTGQSIMIEYSEIQLNAANLQFGFSNIWHDSANTRRQAKKNKTEITPYCQKNQCQAQRARPNNPILRLGDPSRGDQRLKSIKDQRHVRQAVGGGVGQQTPNATQNKKATQNRKRGTPKGQSDAEKIKNGVEARNILHPYSILGCAR